MKVNIALGKYIVAVSGGVDSVVLLHLLVKQANKQKNLQLIVAHFDHGIREDSAKDEQLVRAAAKKHSLIYETEAGKLGKNVSEATAREARYKFLEKIKTKYGAGAIITAHHQDDLIETALLNLIRGTGSRGLSAIKNNSKVFRPLLGFSKDQIISYAKAHKLAWNEDSSNIEDIYLRNYIRNNITPNLTARNKQLFINNIDKVAETNKLLDLNIATLSQQIIDGNVLNRQKFIMLPPEIAHQLLMYWLRSQGYHSYDQKVIKKLTTAIKTASGHTTLPIERGLQIHFGQSVATLTRD